MSSKTNKEKINKMEKSKPNNSPSPFPPISPSKNSPSIRIIIADDHPIVRQGFRQIIESDKDLLIVAEAGDGNTALELIEEHQPEVAVLDIDMPEMSGFVVARQLLKRSVKTEIIFLTMHSNEELFEEAMDLGVKGYVLKDSAISEIITAIKSVAKGRPFLSPSLSMLLLNHRSRANKLEEEKPGLHLLTLTERRILKLIAEEKTSKIIADELFISHRTVETHRTNISRKLDLQGPFALLKFAATHKSEL